MPKPRYRKRRFRRRKRKSFVSRVKAIVNTTRETKWCNQKNVYSAGSLNAWNAATPLQLTYISAVGPTVADGPGTRDGDQVELRRLLMTINLHNDATGTPTSISDYYRIIIFYWDDNIPPTSTDLVEFGGSPNINDQVKDSCIRDKRVFILKDQVIPMSVFNNTKTLNYNMPLKRKCKFNGTTGGNIASGQLYVLLGATDDGITLDASSAVLTSRVFYKDV